MASTCSLYCAVLHTTVTHKVGGRRDHQIIRNYIVHYQWIDLPVDMSIDGRRKHVYALERKQIETQNPPSVEYQKKKTEKGI